jgi:hypothetical protein
MNPWGNLAEWRCNLEIFAPQTFQRSPIAIKDDTTSKPLASGQSSPRWSRPLNVFCLHGICGSTTGPRRLVSVLPEFQVSFWFSWWLTITSDSTCETIIWNWARFSDEKAGNPHNWRKMSTTNLYRYGIDLSWIINMPLNYFSWGDGSSDIPCWVNHPRWFHTKYTADPYPTGTPRCVLSGRQASRTQPDETHSSIISCPGGLSPVFGPRKDMAVGAVQRQC